MDNDLLMWIFFLCEWDKNGSSPTILLHQINLVVYFVNSSCISSQFEYIFEGHFLDLFWASPTPTACPTRRLVSMATKRMMEAKHGIIIKNLPDQAGLALLSCHIYHK